MYQPEHALATSAARQRRRLLPCPDGGGVVLAALWAGWSAPFRGLSARELIVAIADIAIVFYAVYRALRLLRGTRAAQMLLGLVLVGAGIFAAKQLELSTVSWVLDHLLSFSIIFFIVIFQHDLRRALMRVGQGLWWTSRSYERTEVFEEVIRAAERLAHLRIGALIVLERDADLVDHLTEPGVEVGAKVTEELLVALFLPDAENKLHDGAVIIKELRIAQAGAVLPLSGNARLDKALGTRHRAAIGVTEETDAVSVVVSEERGSISLCFGGNVARDLDGATLRKALLGLFQKESKRERSRRRTQTAPQGAIVNVEALAPAASTPPAPSPPPPPRPVGSRSGRVPAIGATLPGLGGTHPPSRAREALDARVREAQRAEERGGREEGEESEHGTSTTTTSTGVLVESSSDPGKAD
jgi:diadenylate cyclase